LIVVIIPTFGPSYGAGFVGYLTKPSASFERTYWFDLCAVWRALNSEIQGNLAAAENTFGA
jgi:hypothetical protein